MEKFFDVTGKRELFIDDFLISSSRGIEFKAHLPIELPCHQGKENGDYVTIMKTPEGYNLYYRGVDSEYKGSRYNNHPGEFVGLLQSKDGLNWTAPELDRYPGKTVPRNTLFYGDEVITHNFVPFCDTHPECTEKERYKAVAGVRETKGLFAYYSADGVNWHKYSDAPVLPYTPEKTGGHMLDSQNVLFYSEAEQCYVMYMRVWKTADGLTKVRSFAKLTSRDFRSWSEPEFLVVNRKQEHLYVSGLAPYPRAPRFYVGAATRYFGNRGSATDMTMLFSREGQGILRPFPGAWITPGLEEERWLNRMNYMAWGIVQAGENEILMYHGKKKLMYKFRTDGFVSIRSKGERCGSFMTRPLFRKGGGLELNAATSAGGYIRLEVCDEKGNPVSGFSFKEMKPFWGDKICWEPEWQGKKFSDLPAGIFRLRIKMKECDLYSICFPQ